MSKDDKAPEDKTPEDQYSEDKNSDDRVDDITADTENTKDATDAIIADDDKDAVLDGGKGGSRTESNGQLNDKKPAQKKATSRGWYYIPLLALLAFAAGVAVFPFAQERLMGPKGGLTPAEKAKLQSLERALTGAATDQEHLRQQVQALGEQLRAQAKVKPKDNSEKLAALATQLAELGERLTKLEKAVANAAANAPAADATTSGDGGEMAARLEALEKALGEYRDKFDNVGNSDLVQGFSQSLSQLKKQMQERLSDLSDMAGKLQKSEKDKEKLSKDLKALQTALSDQMARQTKNAAGLALANVNDALSAGKPAGDALSALAKSVASDAKLKSLVANLQGLLKAPLPTLSSLQSDFDAAARAALLAEKGKGQGILAQTWRKVSGLVSIRRTGPVKGDSTEALLARAENKLMAGDLAGAIAVLDKVKDPARDGMASWLTPAKARADAESLMSDLRLAVISKMAGKS